MTYWLIALTLTLTVQAAEPKVTTTATLTQVTKQGVSGYLVKVKIAVGNEVIFDKELPMPFPATEDEAWKRWKRFKKKELPKIIEKWREKQGNIEEESKCS